MRQRWLIGGLFKLLARPPVVRQVLAQAYPSGNNVDQELLDLLLEPSRDPGAQESFRGFVNLFNDRLAPELLAHLADDSDRMFPAETPLVDPTPAADTFALGCIFYFYLTRGCHPFGTGLLVATSILTGYSDLSGKFSKFLT